MNFFNRKPKTPASPPSNKYSEFDTVAIELIESLRPMFAAHPVVDEVRLNAILDLIHHGEPEIALDTLVGNLQDINWEEISSPISEEQSRQLKYLLHGVYGNEPEREQKYLAIVDRITKVESSEKPSFSAHKSSLGITGLHRFFFVHFYSDSLDDMESIEEAVQMYLKEGLDPQGALLLKEINELLAKDLSDDELSSLIEDDWGAEVEGSDVGSWNTVLQKLLHVLQTGKDQYLVNPDYLKNKAR